MSIRVKLKVATLVLKTGSTGAAVNGYNPHYSMSHRHNKHDNIFHLIGTTQSE